MRESSVDRRMRQGQSKPEEREERRKSGRPAGSYLGHMVKNHMTVICWQMKRYPDEDGQSAVFCKRVLERRWQTPLFIHSADAAAPQAEDPAGRILYFPARTNEDVKEEGYGYF